MSFSKLMENYIIERLISKHNLLDKVLSNSEFRARLNAKYTSMNVLEGDLTIIITDVLPGLESEIISMVTHTLKEESSKLFDLGIIAEAVASTLKQEISKTESHFNNKLIKQLSGRAKSDLFGGVTTKLKGANGKFISKANLSTLLQMATQKYLAAEMKRPDAPLKYRSGRFVNSVRILDILPLKGNAVNVVYDYMTRPYSVFDPEVSTYNYLSLIPYRGARNPRRLISAAIAEAAKEVMHKSLTVTKSRMPNES